MSQWLRRSTFEGIATVAAVAKEEIQWTPIASIVVEDTRPKMAHLEQAIRHLPGLIASYFLGT